MSYQNPVLIFDRLRTNGIDQGVTDLLQRVKAKKVRDSTTIVSWEINHSGETTIPSDG
ncbi:hypothetical protein LCM20_01725 [Halobacillus litoralis]|uniref:hypothetical protein n=1 Tax=Halobacillus litoralis TaxID=45668 RepID=UPI001CD7B7E1|nr:hypothetical protein [Halobacillus litoralis]MCA0969306.1 hypothetical protein [Halobacillus litoralis]